MPQYTTVAVANLATLEKYADQFEVECWTHPVTGVKKMGLFSKAVPTTTLASGTGFTSGYYQSTMMMFTGLTLGTTYYFRDRVNVIGGGPPSPWSAPTGTTTGWVTEVAGDLTAPNPTYSPSATVTTAGVAISANPSGNSSDFDHFEIFYTVNVTGTPGGTVPPTVPRSSTGQFSVVIGNSDTLYCWIRAVDTSGNQQAWKFLGGYTSSGAQSVPPAGKNMCPNPGFEFNTVGTVSNVDLSVGKALTDGWNVSSNDLVSGVPVFSPRWEGSPLGTARTGQGDALIRVLSNVTIPASSILYGCRVFSEVLPVGFGDIIRIRGYTRWDFNNAIPSGLVINQGVGIQIFDSTNTQLSNLTTYLNNSQFGSWRVQQGSVQVADATAAYMRVHLIGFIQNTSASPVATPSGLCADMRFDDMMVVNQVTAFDVTPINTSGTFTSASPLTQSASSTTILVGASTMQFGDGTISFNSGSVNPGSFGTWYIYADDPTFSGGAVTYIATSSPSVTFGANGRIYFGKITTVGSGGGGGSGGGSGGGRLSL